MRYFVKPKLEFNSDIKPALKVLFLIALPFIAFVSLVCLAISCFIKSDVWQFNSYLLFGIVSPFFYVKWLNWSHKKVFPDQYEDEKNK